MVAVIGRWWLAQVWLYLNTAIFKRGSFLLDYQNWGEDFVDVLDQANPDPNDTDHFGHLCNTKRRNVKWQQQKSHNENTVFHFCCFFHFFQTWFTIKGQHTFRHKKYLIECMTQHRLMSLYTWGSATPYNGIISRNLEIFIQTNFGTLKLNFVNNFIVFSSFFHDFVREAHNAKVSVNNQASRERMHTLQASLINRERIFSLFSKQIGPTLPLTWGTQVRTKYHVFRPFTILLDSVFQPFLDSRHPFGIKKFAGP